MFELFGEIQYRIKRFMAGATRIDDVDDIREDEEGDYADTRTGTSEQVIKYPSNPSAHSVSHFKKQYDVFESQAENDADNSQIIFTYPRELKDATYICDQVRKNVSCVVNLEGVPNEDAQRIADFIGGASYALNGSIKRINNEIFMFAPETVNMKNEAKDDARTSRPVFSIASSDR